MDAQRVDDKPNFLTWAIFPALISGAAVWAYVLSSLYVSSVSDAFNFPIGDYLDLIDYVQFLPQLWGTGPLMLLLILLLVYSYIKVIAKYSKKPRILKMPRGRRRWEARWRVLSRRWLQPWEVNVFKAFFPWALPFAILGQTLFTSGASLREEIRTKTISQVFRKGQPCPVVGKIFLHTSRYILLLDRNDLVTAIPQTEVQMIQTPRKSPSPAATAPPSSAPPAVTATPSPTSSTSNQLGANPDP
jgi:hypothetical protein